MPTIVSTTAIMNQEALSAVAGSTGGSPAERRCGTVLPRRSGIHHGIRHRHATAGRPGEAGRDRGRGRGVGRRRVLHGEVVGRGAVVGREVADVEQGLVDGVHAISPGPVPTRAASGLQDFDQLMQKAMERAPLRRLVTLQEIGNLAAFLASDASSGMTGQTLYVDGGYHIVN